MTRPSSFVGHRIRKQGLGSEDGYAVLADLTVFEMITVHTVIRVRGRNVAKDKIAGFE
jgi:hypothetical protein